MLDLTEKHQRDTSTSSTVKPWSRFHFMPETIQKCTIMCISACCVTPAVCISVFISQTVTQADLGQSLVSLVFSLNTLGRRSVRCKRCERIRSSTTHTSGVKPLQSVLDTVSSIITTRLLMQCVFFALTPFSNLGSHWSHPMNDQHIWNYVATKLSKYMLYMKVGYFFSSVSPFRFHTEGIIFFSWDQRCPKHFQCGPDHTIQKDPRAPTPQRFWRGGDWHIYQKATSVAHMTYLANQTISFGHIWMRLIRTSWDTAACATLWRLTGNKLF